MSTIATIDGPDSVTVPMTPALITGQEDNKFVDMALYSRVPRPMSRPHPLPNEIYVRSGPQPLAPLSKRIKQLLFAGNVDSVHIHAAGKQITTAVKLAVDFVNAYTPWFTTLTYSSTEVVIDDYVPKVDFNEEVIVDDYQRYYNDMMANSTSSSSKASSAMTDAEPLATATKRKTMEPNGKKDAVGTKKEGGIGGEDGLVGGEDGVAHTNKRPKPNSNPQDQPQQTMSITTTTSPSRDGEELVQLEDNAPKTIRLQPFSRERFISAIHIIITKTTQGQSHVM